MSGIFDEMFDYDRDGELDTFESAMQFEFMQELADISVESDGDTDADDTDVDTMALDLAGVDTFELQFMDEDERREVLEDAGLDPDEYKSASDYL